MNKAELIDALAGHFDGNKAEASRALKAVLDTVTEQVAQGEKVSITGFGVFEKLHRAARTVRNPRTGERKQAKATDVPRFRPGSEFKAFVAGEKKVTKTAAKPAKKSTTKSTTTKTTAAKTTAAKKSTTTKSAPAKKSTTKSTPAKKTTTKSAPAKKSTTTAAKKSTTPAKKSTTTPAKKSTTKSAATKSAPAKKSTAKATPAKKSTTTAKKSTTTKTTPAKKASTTKATPAKKTTTAAKSAPAKKSTSRQANAKLPTIKATTVPLPESNVVAPASGSMTVPHDATLPPVTIGAPGTADAAQKATRPPLTK